MKKFILFSLVFILFNPLLFLGTAFAEQKIVQDGYQIHYSVFPSNSISPEVAAIYKIKRSGYRAIVNITPQKLLTNGETIGFKAAISGKARNLIGNTKNLDFRAIVEGKVIYYIAEFSFSNEESFRFSVELSPNDEPSKVIPLTFEKKFYTE
jgi:hypothetical protein